jgi:hypothetical protein
LLGQKILSSVVSLFRIEKVIGLSEELRGANVWRSVHLVAVNRCLRNFWVYWPLV